MQVDKELLLKVAKLAKLKIEGDEDQVSADLTKVLSWMEKLKEVDTDGVEPLVYLSIEQSVARQDKVGVHLDRALALGNAPDADGKYFLVPKVIPQD